MVFAVMSAILQLTGPIVILFKASFACFSRSSKAMEEGSQSYLRSLEPIRNFVVCSHWDI